MAKVRVLVADDNPDTRELYNFILSRAGFEVKEAEDGEEALDALEKDGVDLLLTDLMMPGLDGLELIQRVRSEAGFAQLPIIAMSAHHDILTRAHYLGATEAIPKPIDPDDLLDAILRTLPKGKMQSH
jgi:CheY-like chemotaxis protein